MLYCSATKTNEVAAHGEDMYWRVAAHGEDMYWRVAAHGEDMYWRVAAHGEDMLKQDGKMTPAVERDTEAPAPPLLDLPALP